MEKKCFDEKLLLERLRQGDENAFRSLFEDFYASLCLFAMHYLKDREEVADIVQESFFKYWSKHADFDDYRKVKSFLYIVVRHACLNQLRNKCVHAHAIEKFTEDSNQEFQNQMMEEEIHRLFNRAIDDLPTQMRSVINYSLDGLKNFEIAKKMNISEGTVHAYKKEAYKKLRNSLREYYCLLFIVLFLP